MQIIDIDGSSLIYRTPNTENMDKNAIHFVVPMSVASKDAITSFDG